MPKFGSSALRVGQAQAGTKLDSPGGACHVWLFYTPLRIQGVPRVCTALLDFILLFYLSVRSALNCSALALLLFCAYTELSWL